MSYYANYDDKKRAKEMDMRKLLDREGIRYEKNNKNDDYRLVEHDSLVFGRGDNGLWNFTWYSQNEKGDIIEFVRVYFGKKRFPEIIQFILGKSDNNIRKEPVKPIIQASEPAIAKADKPKGFIMPELTDDMKKAYGYLIKSRGISSKIVKKLAEQKLILQTTEYSNVVFPMLDECGQVVGAEARETYTYNDSKFKSIFENSKRGYGFNVRIGDIETIHFFESAIDLLSFWSLMPNINNVLLVSMGGLKDVVVEHYTKLYPDANISLCVDNDSAGRAFALKLKQIYPNSEYWEMDKNTSNSKDWNELLINYTKVNNHIAVDREIS